MGWQSWSGQRRRRLLRSGSVLVVLVALLTWLGLRTSGDGSRTVAQTPSRSDSHTSADHTANHGTAANQRPGQSVGPNAGPSSTTRPLGDGQAVTLAFGGDIHFEGPLAARLADNPATALGPVASLFAGSDLAMANFESALTNGGCPQPQAKQFVFHAPPSALTAIRSAGSRW